MSGGTRVKTHAGVQLSLPPGFNLVTLREVGDAFEHARENAEELGAGTLVFVGRFDLCEFAVVLEPDEPLSTARRAFYAGMCALGDALASHSPPERQITFDWPDTVQVNGGLIGGGQIAWPDGPEQRQPKWLVFGAMIRTVSLAEGDPGLRPLASALEDEGFEDFSAADLAGSFSRHLMTAFDKWHEHGFGEMSKDYLSRLKPDKGVSRSVADNGDLLIRRIAKSDIERRQLVPALRAPSWFDPKTRGPR
jgi:hypothetical protein